MRALVFDSGVGGLSVVAEVRRRLPELALDYAADDAFRPYGEKTQDQLRSRLPGLVRSLADMTGADIAVIACNTASVTALDAIRAESSISVVGVVPAVKPAARRTRSGTLGVLGTPATIRQVYVDELIADFASDREVQRLGSVALVKMAEAKLAGQKIDADVLAREIAPLFTDPDLDTVVLACTHFPLLREELEAASPRPVTWVDSGEAIARRVESLIGTPGAVAERPDTAFLVGDRVDPVRARAFADYAFSRTVALHEGMDQPIE